MKKIEIALKIYNDNKDAPRADVIEKIMKKLDVTKGNASIYYAKSVDRAKAETATPSKPKKEDTAKKDEAPVAEVAKKVDRDLNSEIRATIDNSLAEIDESEIPLYLRKDWEQRQNARRNRV